MEYTVNQLANLAGVSPRTIRYYDEIGLLHPARFSDSGYRVYGPAEVDRLQEILFFRELGVSLNVICEMLTDPNYDRVGALQSHRKQLVRERERLDALIANVDKTISTEEGTMTMQDQEKFEGFKRELLANNEAEYGEEIRTRYGSNVVDQSNQMLEEMTQAEYQAWMDLESEVKRSLAAAFRTGDPAGELAQHTAELHKQWLMRVWPKYTPGAHAGLAQMYVDDERFAAYYDADQSGLAQFLRDAIHIYTR